MYLPIEIDIGMFIFMSIYGVHVHVVDIWYTSVYVNKKSPYSNSNYLSSTVSIV